MNRKKVSLIGLECQDRLVENFPVVASEQWQHMKLGYGHSQNWHLCSATVPGCERHREGAELEAERPVGNPYWVRNEMKFLCNIIYFLTNF